MDEGVILERALTVFTKYGYSSTSVASLAAATKQNKKMLYARFPSKEALFSAALSHFINKQEETNAILRRTPLGFQNIKDYLDRCMKSNKDGNLISHLIHDKHNLSVPLMEKVRRTFTAQEEDLRANFDAAKAAGDCRADLSTKAAARYVILLTEGCHTIDRLGVCGQSPEVLALSLDALRA